MKNTVLSFLTDTVKQYAHKEAVVDGERRLTFRELDLAARRLGSVIVRLNGTARQPVAVFVPKSADSIVAFLGILYSGNFYVPLDESLPPARIKTILGNLRPVLIITTLAGRETMLTMGMAEQQYILVSDAYDDAAAVDAAILDRIVEQVIDTDPVYVIYTSGSTGVPKGVVVAHRGVIDYIDWAVGSFGIDSSVVIGNQSPFYFDNSTLDLYLMLATGATLVIIPKHLFAFPLRLMEYVNSELINFIFWVPSVLINVANRRILENMERSPLTRILFAGEVMPNKHLNYWRKHIPQALYANLYGPTEITVDCTYFIVDREFQDCDPLPIGFPCRNSDIIVLNNENQPVIGSEIGELCVRGSSLALGYWNDLEKTKAAFVQNPLQDHYPERIYRTGDLVSYNDRQEIIYMGRKDSQIKHLGHRIELGDIETTVLGIERIESASVLYNKTKEEIILLYSSTEQLETKDIRKELTKLLPKYMVPGIIHFLDDIPLNANGKIDRVKLQTEFCR